MLSQDLKENTKYNHQLLEKKLVNSIKSIDNEKGYTALLSLFYSFFGGLELAIDKHIDTSALPDYAQRRKTSALANDLIHLSAKTPALASNNALPEINNHLHALGVLYVIEGSTLGGKIISKMIRQQLNLPDLSGLSFFNGYGEQTEKMWLIFKQSIDQAIYYGKEDIIIQSANDTFIQFRHWFDHCSL